MAVLKLLMYFMSIKPGEVVVLNLITTELQQALQDGSLKAVDVLHVYQARVSSCTELNYNRTPADFTRC